MKNFAIGFAGTIFIFALISLYALISIKWPHIVLPTMAFFTCCIGGLAYRRVKDDK